MKEKLNTVICGDTLSVLKTLPGESVDCIVTSPPYWSLRAYHSEPVVWGADANCEHKWQEEKSTLLHENRNNLIGTQEEVVGKKGTAYIKKYDDKVAHFCSLCGAWKGELGLEPTPSAYIEHLKMVFTELKRVLKKTGTCWVNIGDLFSGSPAGNFGENMPRPADGGAYKENKPNIKTDIPAKSLCAIPERFVLMMLDLGFIRRNTIIWWKRSCMPSSASDRFTVDFEYLYFYTKDGDYWFEQQFEEHQTENLEYEKHKASKWGKRKIETCKPNALKYANEDDNHGYNPLGRNKRCVWEINPQPCNYEYCEKCDTLFVGSERSRIERIDKVPVGKCPVCKNTDGWVQHFAAFPEELCETPIKAGCPDAICEKCGKAREKIYEIEYQGRPTFDQWRKNQDTGKWKGSGRGVGIENEAPGWGSSVSQYYEKVWDGKMPNKNAGYSQCSCGAPLKSGVVLDPFIGTGTTALVAMRLGRSFIGIDVQPRYVKMAQKRIDVAKAQGGLF